MSDDRENIGFIFGDYAETYSSDLKLFNELGLSPFEIKNQNETFVGEYKLPDHNQATIKIWVTCMPAQFWKFEITTDGNKFRVETGSGSLTKYWPNIILIAKGTLVIDELEESMDDGICIKVDYDDDDVKLNVSLDEVPNVFEVLSDEGERFKVETTGKPSEYKQCIMDVAQGMFCVKKINEN